MTQNEFTEFLSKVYALLCQFSNDGSIHQICMDWRHLVEMLEAGKDVYFRAQKFVRLE